MGKAVKIITGLGVMAGISYFGRSRMNADRIMARSEGAMGYIMGLGQGFLYGLKSMFRLQTR